MNVYQRNYRKLLQLIPTLSDLQSVAKLTAPGQADIEIRIADRHREKLVLRMTHFREQGSNELVVDLDMTVAVFLRARVAEVLTYQDCFGYRQVYCTDLMAFSPLAQRDLNALLDQWLTSLVTQNRVLCVTDISKSASRVDEGKRT
jgi:uncharacterized protein YqiB (DUF1249 family)